MTPKSSLPKRLPLSRVRAGTNWLRIHAQARSSLWFGPARGRPAIHRFDDPSGRFRVCYFGTTLEVCFAETFLRNPPVRILALDDLARRSIATVEVRRDLRLVPIHGPSLARLGVTAELASGNDYPTSQLWSRALWEHGDQPDGVLYRSRHDDSALCVAVYDRAKDGLVTVQEDSLAGDPQQLARLLRRYGLGLTN
jgi:RES domain